jgi:hypothetical protein
VAATGAKLLLFLGLLALASPNPAARGHVTSSIPQAGQLESGLRRLGLQAEPGEKRLALGRFPLSFPVDRSHGCYKSGSGFRLCAHGHGQSWRRYLSVSFEFLFWDLSRLESDLDVVRGSMAEVGLGVEPQRAVLGRLRDVAARLSAARPVDSHWAEVPADQVEIVSGMQIRFEGRLNRGPGGSGGRVIVQFTDLRAPQASWPSPAEVEGLFPFERRRPYGTNSDVLEFLEPEVFDLDCRPAGRDRLRCSYVVTATDWLSGRPPRDRYTDLFLKRPDGKWQLLAPDAGVSQREAE